jgi:hypothetical protein
MDGTIVETTGQCKEGLDISRTAIGKNVHAADFGNVAGTGPETLQANLSG